MLQEISKALFSFFIGTVVWKFYSTYIKYFKEKSILETSCKEIVNLSIILFNELNEFLIKSGKSVISDFFNDESENTIKELDLKINMKNQMVFYLILNKFINIRKLKYIKISDALITVCDNITSKPNQEKSHNQLYLELILMLKCMKTLFQEQNYIEKINQKIKDSIVVSEKENYIYHEAYIIQCLENDLAEKQSIF